MNSTNNKSHDDGTSNHNCEVYKRRIRGLEQALDEANDEFSYAYPLHEDDMLRIKELEGTLFHTHILTDKGGN